MPTKYTTRVRVQVLEERFDHLWKSGTAANAIFDQRSKGWFLIATGGTFHFGADKPTELEVGSMITISFQREEPPDGVVNIQPKQPAPKHDAERVEGS